MSLDVVQLYSSAGSNSLRSTGSTPAIVILCSTFSTYACLSAGSMCSDVTPEKSHVANVLSPAAKAVEPLSCSIVSVAGRQKRLAQSVQEVTAMTGPAATKSQRCLLRS